MCRTNRERRQLPVPRRVPPLTTMAARCVELRRLFFAMIACARFAIIFWGLPLERAQLRPAIADRWPPRIETGPNGRALWRAAPIAAVTNAERLRLLDRTPLAAIVVNGGTRLEQELPAFPGGAHISTHALPLRAMIRALRPHQWAKNALILVPLVAAHHAGDAGSLLAGVLAFVAFSLCASSVYLLNDLLDLEADRAHPRKSKRPFAAGQSIAAGRVRDGALPAGGRGHHRGVSAREILARAGYLLCAQPAPTPLA